MKMLGLLVPLAEALVLVPLLLPWEVLTPLDPNLRQVTGLK